MSIPLTNDRKAWVKYYVEDLNWILMPVASNKLPMLKKWNELVDKPMSLEMLYWYMDNQSAGMAVITCEKTVNIVDDDYPKEVNKNEVRPPGTELESTVVAKSQSGGFHYYFKPMNLKNKQGQASPTGGKFHIDNRGSSPGYALLPPFFGYEWVKPPTAEAIVNLPNKIPSEILRIWNTAAPINSKYILSADFRNAIGSGEFRDPILFSTSMSLWKNHFEDPEAYTPKLIASFLMELNNSFTPPKDDGTVQKCFKQGHQYAKEWAVKRGLIETAPAMIESDLGGMSEDELIHVEHYPTILTGIEELDMRGGLPTGLTPIIAQSGGGKSWFMLHLAQKAWELNQKRTAIFTLEMTTDGLKNRMLQLFSKMTYDQFVASTPDQRRVGAKKILEISPMIVDYTKQNGSVTPQQLTDRFKDLYARGYRIFILDHFHELPGVSVNEKNQAAAESWGNVLTHIRNIYPDVWLFILTQTSKDKYKKDTLTKEDIKGSAVLAEKSDFVLSINWNKDSAPGAQSLHLWIDKNRRTGMDHYKVEVLLSQWGEFVSANSQQNSVAEAMYQESLL